MATDVAQRLKKHLFRLAGGGSDSLETDETYSGPDQPPPASLTNDFIIPTHDKYWDLFFTQPQTGADVFSLISHADLRYIRDSHRTNFLTFVRVLVERILLIPKQSRSFPRDATTVRQLLNAIRFLTKVLPVLFEDEEDDNSDDSKALFWSVNFSLDLNTANFNSAESNGATVGTSAINRNNNNGSASGDAGPSSLSSNSLGENINAKIRGSSPGTSTAVNVGVSEQVDDCLGVQLITCLVDLLFWRGFTLAKETTNGSTDNVDGVNLKIWETGIGMNGKYSPPDAKLDSNRLEVLRLIITLCSKELYLTSKEVISKGSRFLTVLVSTLPRLKFLTFICSLLNLVCRSVKANHEVNGLSYANGSNKDLRKELATNSLHLLTTMLVYPLPSSDLKFLNELNIFPKSNEYTKPINFVRSYLGKLHKENELNFIYQSLYQFLNKPLETAIENEAHPFSILKSNNNELQGNSLPKLSSWSVEIVMLLWELIQCNKNFKKFVVAKKSNELMITLLYYLKYYRNTPQLRMNLIRVISFLFLYLTSDKAILQKLLQPFNNTHYTTKLPIFYRLNNNQNSTNITYRDFIIISISNSLTNLNEFDELLSPTFFEYLYNLIPLSADPEEVKLKATLSYNSCLSIINVISAFASPSGILLKDPLKLDLLTLLLRAVTNAICRYFKESRTLMYLVLKHEKIFQNILKLLQDYKIDSDVSDSSDNNDGSGPRTPLISASPRLGGTPQPGTPQPTTPSNERFESGYNTEDEFETDNDDDNADPNSDVDEFEECLRPKPPAGMSTKAKSKLPLDVSLVTKWPGYKSLTILLRLVKIINENLEFQELNGSLSSKFEIMEILIKIENLKPFLDEKFFSYLPSEFNPQRSPFDQLKFNWSELSLGWYSSILWSEIYLSNNITALKAIEQQGSNGPASWFSRKPTTMSVKEVASSWGFNWKSSSLASPGSKEAKGSEQAALDGFQFDVGILIVKIWHGTSIKLFKLRRDTLHQSNGISSVNELMKRFRLSSSENVPTVGNPNGSVAQHRGSVVSVNSNNSHNNSHRVSISGGSTYQLTPITSRQSFGTPRNSVAGISVNDLSRINSRQSLI